MKIRATILAGMGAVCAALSFAVQANEERALTGAERVWLDAHNTERAEFGTAPLAWNARLAREAEVWAEQLARESRLRHSRRDTREGIGENLWMGTAGRFSPARMMEAFAREKAYFRPGTFPDVSTTGRTGDVGHYTQIVWSETREVGCATARGQRYDVLVCRYWPAGNVIGRRIAPQESTARR